ncbi:hypothetical protein C427_5261 [Paraglaciecola psychrophila 170]|uniref:Uncharacterized protein n=1 Tax=Paraglaciecola psychrophila 170 TaxID=1129794 RepID=K6ZKK6_9ALTE|nr:hypothetical protein C427_5261 [Paraglaciecola psychrophila 170]GAC36511.1 hypothetical protein GPSY_0873 [Paraglaciecola psychrophila 170]
MSNDAYAKLIFLSQILPGPSSSQFGFAKGLHKGGLAMVLRLLLALLYHHFY